MPCRWSGWFWSEYRSAIWHRYFGKEIVARNQMNSNGVIVGQTQMKQQICSADMGQQTGAKRQDRGDKTGQRGAGYKPETRDGSLRSSRDQWMTGTNGGVVGHGVRSVRSYALGLTIAELIILAPGPIILPS